MTELKETLSDRELEILRLVATGAANKEIARQLVISPNTVKVHLRNIFAKIGVMSRTEATLYAVQIGLVKPSAEPATVADASPDEESLTGELPENDLESSSLLGISESADGATVLPARRGGLSWRAGLLVLFALLLAGLGAVFGARLLASPTPIPTAIQSATTNPQVLTVNRWANGAALPTPRKGMGVVEYENAFYVIGGETSQGLDASTLRYDPLQQTWEELKPKDTPVTEVHAVLLGEKIYVPGGKLEDGSLTNRLEVYDPRGDAWERMADLPVAVSGYALAALEGRLYLFGGKDRRSYREEVYIYDPQEDRWSEGTRMDHPRAFAGAVTVGGKIYVIGGYDGRRALKLNQAYMPSRDGGSEDPWETYAPLDRGRYGMGVTSLASIIYLIGGWGEDGQPDTNGTRQYVVQTDQWAGFDRPPQSTGAMPGLIASGNFLYVMGGETGKGPSGVLQKYQAIYTVSVPLVGSDSGE